MSIRHATCNCFGPPCCTVVTQGVSECLVGDLASQTRKLYVRISDESQQAQFENIGCSCSPSLVRGTPPGGGDPNSLVEHVVVWDLINVVPCASNGSDGYSQIDIVWYSAVERRLYAGKAGYSIFGWAENFDGDFSHPVTIPARGRCDFAPIGVQPLEDCRRRYGLGFDMFGPYNGGTATVIFSQNTIDGCCGSTSAGGLCCLDAGGYVITSRDQCAAIGGTYMGDGTYPITTTCIQDCCVPGVHRFAAVFGMPTIDPACDCQPLRCALDALVFAPPDAIGPYIVTEYQNTYCVWSGTREGDCFDDTGHATHHFVLYVELRNIHSGSGFVGAQGRATVQFTSGFLGGCVPPTYVFDGRKNFPLPIGEPCHGISFQSLGGDCFADGATLTFFPVG